MNEREPLFSPPPVAPPGAVLRPAPRSGPARSATSVARVPRKLRHMKVDKARSCSSSSNYPRLSPCLSASVVNIFINERKSPHPPLQLAAQVPDDLLRHLAWLASSTYRSTPPVRPGSRFLHLAQSCAAPFFARLAKAIVMSVRLEWQARFDHRARLGAALECGSLLPLSAPGLATACRLSCLLPRLRASPSGRFAPFRRALRLRVKVRQVRRSLCGLSSSSLCGPAPRELRVA
jgi:hypothetical protein